MRQKRLLRARLGIAIRYQNRHSLNDAGMTGRGRYGAVTARERYAQVFFSSFLTLQEIVVVAHEVRVRSCAEFMEIQALPLAFGRDAHGEETIYQPDHAVR